MWDSCFYLNWEIAFLKIVSCRLNAKPGWGNTALYTERIIRNISLEWYPECELLNLPAYLWNRKSYRSAYVTWLFEKKRWWFFSAVPFAKWTNILQNPLSAFPHRAPARGHTEKQTHALQRATSDDLSRQLDTRTSLGYLMGEKGQFVFSFSAYKSPVKKFICKRLEQYKQAIRSSVIWGWAASWPKRFLDVLHPCHSSTQLHHPDGSQMIPFLPAEICRGLASMQSDSCSTHL